MLPKQSPGKDCPKWFSIAFLVVAKAGIWNIFRILVQNGLLRERYSEIFNIHQQKMLAEGTLLNISSDEWCTTVRTPSCNTIPANHLDGCIWCAPESHGAQMAQKHVHTIKTTLPVLYLSTMTYYTANSYERSLVSVLAHNGLFFLNDAMVSLMSTA